jgi:hypothetical protein
LKKLHLWIYAYFVKWHRVRATLKAFRSAHSQEISKTPVYLMPSVIARQEREIAAIKAGKLDASITDRKSWAWPFLPASVNRLSVPLIKATPYNIRRMSRTPVPRRAMNLIKGSVISQPWDVRPIEGVPPTTDENDQTERIKIAKKVFSHPNNVDSFQTFMEQGLEDMCVFGAFVAELAVTPDPERPLKMWCMNVESIRIFAAWTESTPEMPHYAQMTGLKGERGALLFYEDEVLYVKDNPATDNPFGLGKMEVAFQSVNDFLGVQGMAGRAGTDQIHKTFLWWEAPQNEAHVQIVRRHIQNELEGQAKLSIITGMKKPEPIEVNPVTEQDLLLNWQELLIRMIANGFDMSAMALGVEHDVNRAVGEVLDDKDFRSAVVPMAKRLQEAVTRKVLHGKLGWTDLEFTFLSLDDPDSQTKMDMLTRMFQSNAVAPNEIREKMGFRKVKNPLYDLTQFEMMLLNAEVAANLQNKNQDRALQRQMMVSPTGYGGPGYGPPMPLDPGPETTGPLDNGQKGGAGGGGGPMGQAGQKGITAPKSLSLPKFPIAAGYSARELSQMPVNQITDVMRSSGMSATVLLRAMDDQEPGILEELTEEVKQFFDTMLKEEKAKPQPISKKTLNRWTKDLAVRVRKQNQRTADMASWLYRVGRTTGRPGQSARDLPVFAPKDRRAGKPGVPPRIQGI